MNKTAEKLEKLLEAYPEDAHIFRTLQEKPDGSMRPIVKPNKALSKWLKKVLKVLRGSRRDWPTFIHGGVRKRSYVSFARPHSNKKTVISLDIRDCFGSINQKQVVDSLVSKLKLPNDLMKRLASKLCVDGKIPQGFSTSNFLTNLYLNDALLVIHRKLVRKHVEMTVYVDDIALSGNDLDNAEAINIVCIELSRARLAIKKTKVKIMNSNQRQIIVGLVINKGIAITKEKRKELFSRVAQKTISETSLDGWLANLNMINKTLMDKLKVYAISKGYKINFKKKPTRK